MDKEYSFEFWRWHFDTDNFKEKQAQVVINTIMGSRLAQNMRFSAYGNFSYDEEDKGHRYPKITVLKKFTRTKSNCLIFDLPVTEYNNGLFDKLFIYQSNGPKEGNYGYVFYNSKTGRIIHKYYVDHIYDDLCVQLSKSFRRLFDIHKYEFYSKKFDSITKRIDEEYGNVRDYVNHFGRTM